MTAGPVRSNAAAPDGDAGAKLLKLESDLGAARRDATELREALVRLIDVCEAVTQNSRGSLAARTLVNRADAEMGRARRALAGGATREPQTS